MIVSIIKDYNDGELKRIVKSGEELTVSMERGMALINARVAKVIDMQIDAETDELALSVTEITALKQILEVMTEYAYMPDAQLLVLAKEKGVDGRVKDRKVIIDALMDRAKEKEPLVSDTETNL